MEHYSTLEITYPPAWEDEYRSIGCVRHWRERYPDLFDPSWVGPDGEMTKQIGSLDMFPQYALMFLLRDQQGINSTTWYDLFADPAKPSKNTDRRTRLWNIMRQVMGEAKFAKLQTRVMGLTGEPDLFCWDATSNKWFFAEAKHKDKLLPGQLEWFRICNECLSDEAEIRVYRLRKGDN